MVRQKVEIQPPLAGLDSNWAFQSQPPFSLPDANNVRCRDVFESRSRLGSRPGLVKTFCQNVSTPDEVEAFGPFDLAPSKDNYIGGDISPIDSNRGSQTSLIVGRQSNVLLPGYAPNRILIHFDLTVIPLGATITLANLVLDYVGNINLPLAKVHRIGVTGGGATPAWTELGSNWAKYDGVTNWTAAGGDFDLTTPAPIDWQIQAGDTTISVLSHAVDAYTNRSRQLHMLLKTADDLVASLDHGHYASNNHATTTRRPKLTYAYEI